MKKNLRNVLALALGLMTTVSFAQDWNVDSRTRMDMTERVSGEDYRLTTQRVTLGVSWGGSDWGIYTSSDFNYSLGDPTNDDNGLSTAPSASIYEAYASANLMGMASMTVGRQALSYGSGALVGVNDWSNEGRNTWDGITLGFDLDMADVSLGYAARNDEGSDFNTSSWNPDGDEVTNMWLNMAGEFSGWNVNVLYLTNSNDAEDAAYGVDISGGVMGASVSGSMNTDYAGNTMRAINLGYAATDNINLSVGQTAYSDEGQFGANLASDMSAGSWNETGTIGYLAKGDEDITYGLTYAAGGISVGATMHRITNTIDENYERAAMELNVGYSLGNNASLGLKYITDDNGDATAEESKYTYLTLTVTP